MSPANKLNEFDVLCTVVYLVVGNGKPSQKENNEEGKEFVILIFSCFIIKDTCRYFGNSEV